MQCVRLISCLFRQSSIRLVPKPISVTHNNVNHVRMCSLISSDEYEEESDRIVKELCKDNPILEKKLRIIMLDISVMKEDGKLIPDHLHINHWRQILKLKSRHQRSNYLMYLWKTERAKENAKAKKQQNKIKREQTPHVKHKEYEDDLLYGISDQSLLLQVRDYSINKMDNYRSLQSIQYGQKIVIDCAYDDHMVTREAVSAAKQMTFLYGDNRIHKDPFDVYMTGVKFDGDFMHQLKTNIPTLHEPWFPMNIHEESYLDLFPKDQLVYLTPHCLEELTEFDHDAIYIVGCMVDMSNKLPLSHAKAKKEGIKMAKLPLERYLEWAPGSHKTLNINHMIPILLDLKTTGDWEYSLRHVPRRKIMNTQINKMKGSLKNRFLLKDFEDAIKYNSKVKKGRFGDDYWSSNNS